MTGLGLGGSASAPNLSESHSSGNVHGLHQPAATPQSKRKQLSNEEPDERV